MNIFWRRFVFASTVSLFALLPAHGQAQNVPDDGRSVSGTVTPSTGTTAGSKVVQTKKSVAPVPAAGSLSGSPEAGRCAALRKRYAQSQACFQQFRLKNGGLRPGASRHCKSIKNPSTTCGSEIVG
ncbi:MAG: hypothetical protein ABI281_02800 [Caldimonas sp.]